MLAFIQIGVWNRVGVNIPFKSAFGVVALRYVRPSEVGIIGACEREY